MTDPHGDYAAEILAWRTQREARLRRPDGWLSLVGLHWLHPGENRLGSDSRSEVPLRPEDGSLPALAGRILVADGGVRLIAEPGAGLLHDGEPVSELELRNDLEGEPTVVAGGSVRFHLVRRGVRLGIRVRDTATPALRQFRGLDYFPIDRRWRLAAAFEPSPDGRTISVPNVLGDAEETPTPGGVTFTVNGVVCRLDLLLGDDEQPWLVFADATNGTETYEGGRFLYIDPPSAGTAVVDFNRAYNPPCVFTPYATCPLPPPQNRLGVRIEAGERSFAAAAGPRLD